MEKMRYGWSLLRYGLAPCDVPITNGFVHQLRSDGAIDSTTHSTNDPTLGTTNISNSRDLFSNELFLIDQGHME
jgi:hypothetical protein